MSYDISLSDPVTGETLELDEPHYMRGGTYCVDGECRAHLNITYNYSKHYYRVFTPRPVREDIEGDQHNSGDDGMVWGIRSIYGLTGAQSIPVLRSAIAWLGDDVHTDYWHPSEGNAKRALTQLLALAQMRPDGVWAGD